MKGTIHSVGCVALILIMTLILPTNSGHVVKRLVLPQTVPGQWHTKCLCHSQRIGVVKIGADLWKIAAVARSCMQIDTVCRLEHDLLQEGMCNTTR